MQSASADICLSLAACHDMLNAKHAAQRVIDCPFMMKALAKSADNGMSTSTQLALSPSPVSAY